VAGDSRGAVLYTTPVFRSPQHEELLQSAQQGDREALDQLIRLYHERVYRFGLRVCRNPVDAEDAVQDAFLALSRTVGSFRGESSLTTWLFTVVKNACYRFFRRLIGRRRTLGDGPELPEVASEQLSAEEALGRARVLRTVQDTIATLEAPYRDVLLLRDVEGLSGAEVAHRLGITVPAMKTRLFRARSAVRTRLLELEKVSPPERNDAPSGDRSSP
jgi:RNA polymerase sigma-70 factor, ECF subfamily